MKKFLHKAGKLPDEWILYELLLQYDYTESPTNRVAGDARNSLEYIKKNLKYKIELLLKNHKKYTEELTSNNFSSYLDSPLRNKIKSLFFIDDKNKEKININNYWDQPLSELYKSSMLGPLGAYLTKGSIDLNQIKEVYVSDFNICKDLIYGSILTTSLGWISWAMVKGDKRFFKELEFKTNFFISWNKHTKESSEKAMFVKYHKFNEEKFGRNFDIFKNITTYWFIKEINQFYDDLYNSSLYLPFMYD